MEVSRVFLEILRSASKGAGYSLPDGFTESDTRDLIQISKKHRVLPMTAETVLKERESPDTPAMRRLRREAVRITASQAIRTADFLETYTALKRAGLRIAVTKGITIRVLYPFPEQRGSIDEDLLIDPPDMKACHDMLLGLGYRPEPEDSDPTSCEEICYFSSDRRSGIEVHKTLFSSTSPAAGCNAFFASALQRTVETEAYGITITTLCPTDHLLFLILHAYKHLLFSGIGVRPVMDIGMLSKEFRESIDWQYIHDCCAAMNLTAFAAALYRITEKYLGFFVPEVFADKDVDEADLLADILDAGLYGTSDTDRVHSSRITLDAVSAGKEGRRASGLRASLFPGKEYLKKHYPYAEKHPYLLPAAWAQRIITYLGNRKENDPKKSLSIGRSRIELLRKYGIIS